MGILPIRRQKVSKVAAERAALAAGIQRIADRAADDAKNARAISVAAEATRLARHAVWAAEEALSKAQQTATRDLVASYRDETAGPILYPSDARAALDTARERLAIAEAAEEQLKGLETRPLYGTLPGDAAKAEKSGLRKLAGAVLRVEFADEARAIADEVQRLQAELCRKSQALRYLTEVEAFPVSEQIGGHYGKPDDPGIRQALQRLETPPCSWSEIWDREDGASAIRAAVEALQADPTAPLPEIR